MNDFNNGKDFDQFNMLIEERYAIYFTLPVDHPVYQLATVWLGYDVCAGRMIEDVEKDVYHRDLKDLAKHTTDPMRYGFHATLKAPFRLHEDRTVEELKSELLRFSQEYKAFKCKTLKIKTLNQFLALVPTKPCKKLQRLASDCVKLFDPFRAPLSSKEIAKRNPDKLNPQQMENLEQWGYPYVFDEFRFHMTLSNKLNKEDAKIVRKCLKELFRSFLKRPLKVDQISLFYQETIDKPFVLLKRYPLEG